MINTKRYVVTCKGKKNVLFFGADRRSPPSSDNLNFDFLRIFEEDRCFLSREQALKCFQEGGIEHKEAKIHKVAIGEELMAHEIRELRREQLIEEKGLDKDDLALLQEVK